MCLVIGVEDCHENVWARLCSTGSECSLSWRDLRAVSNPPTCPISPVFTKLHKTCFNYLFFFHRNDLMSQLWMSISTVTLFRCFGGINTRVKHTMAHTGAHAKSCHSGVSTAVLFLWGQGSALRRDEQGIMSSTWNTLTSKVLVVGYRLEASETIGRAKEKKDLRKRKGWMRVWRKDGEVLGFSLGGVQKMGQEWVTDTEYKYIITDFSWI